MNKRTKRFRVSFDGDWKLVRGNQIHCEGKKQRPIKIADITTHYKNWRVNAKILAAAKDTLKACEIALNAFQLPDDHPVKKILRQAVAKGRGRNLGIKKILDSNVKEIKIK